MTTVLFDPILFRGLFPAFKVEEQFPTLQLQTYWDLATAYVNDQAGGCYIYALKAKQQVFALNLMTAHIAYLNQQMASGQTTGVVTGASIDKVSVTLLAPPSNNQWQFWLNQSPYGQQLLALFTVASAGGFYYGGNPVVPAFRR